MPAIVKVKVVEGKDLPVMDRASDLTDAFVELRLGNVTYKTEVCRKSLNPIWDSEWFKFEVDDEELQEEFLQLKVLDYDVYSSHDAIGKVNIDLDLLTLKSGSNESGGGTNELGGYFPIYDTLHGIRGYMKIKVRIQYFFDSNKYRQTSCGVKFFSSSSVPTGHTAHNIQGLVDELLVDDDPEYKWIDKIRTPRASNEARQRLFSKLAGEVKRKIGLQVLELGGNAVIGYQQNFDFEGETGIVIRGIGTSVTLTPDSDNSNLQMTALSPADTIAQEKNLHDSFISQSWPSTRFHGQLMSESEYQDKIYGESPETNLPPSLQRVKTIVEEQECPFFTLSSLPNGFVYHLGGIVSSRSVKLLDKIKDQDVPETRDMWWKELRTEIRSHTKAMGCHAVLGYSEYTTICDDLIVLSASGTAAVIRYDELQDEQNIIDDGLDGDYIDMIPTRRTIRRQYEFDSSSINSTTCLTNLPSCYPCHIPYTDVDLPLPINLSRCMFCRQEKVPDILFATIDVPEELPITGKGCMIQARVVRWKKKEKDETNAENVSQILPFLEFDLHQQLINKLKIKGMNAIFGMKTNLSIGEQCIIGIMTGTAVFLTALPPPPMLVISSRRGNDQSSNEKVFGDIQKKIIETTKSNQVTYNLKSDFVPDGKHTRTFSGADEIDGNHLKNGKLDFLADGKDTYILEVDDQSDSSILPLLSDAHHQGFDVFNIDSTPGLTSHKQQTGFQQEQQFFTLFTRVKIPMHVEESHKASLWLSTICDNILMSVRFKARTMIPCCLTKTNFDIDVDDDDFFHIALTAYATKINDQVYKPTKEISVSKDPEDKHIYEADGTTKLGGANQQNRKTSNNNSSYYTPVTICPMAIVPNTQVVSYYGNINVFLIRESTSIKEDGGLNLFMQQFISEIHAIIRAQVLALGGNAILSFRLNEILFLYNPHKNQAQCLINVSGDAAEIKSCPDNCLEHFISRVSSSSSSINSSTMTPKPPEVIEEIKYKLDRAVYGTSV